MSSRISDGLLNEKRNSDAERDRECEFVNAKEREKDKLNGV